MIAVDMPAFFIMVAWLCLATYVVIGIGMDALMPALMRTLKRSMIKSERENLIMLQQQRNWVSPFQRFIGIEKNMI